jgi:hypothetical protein
MFTWICPQCGREVPPAYTECPDCAAKAAGAAAPPPDQPPAQQIYPPPPPQYQQPPYQQGPYPPPPYPYPQQPYPPQPPYGQPQGQPPQYQPPYPPPPQYRQPPYQQPVYQQPQYAPPPPPVSEPRETTPPPQLGAYSHLASEPEKPREAPRGSALFGAPPAPAPRSSGMPTWLLTILCTAGFAALVAGAYWLFGSHRAPAPSTTVESPAAKPGVAASPWQKFIEVSGIRFVEDPKHKDKILVKFLVTNHSESNLGSVSGNVTIWAGTKKSDEDAQGSFAFTTSVGPYESKETTAPFNTKLKVYELPDWNVINTDLQITNPAGAGSGELPSVQVPSLALARNPAARLRVALAP